MKRSAIRVRFPDSVSLHPGYVTTALLDAGADVDAQDYLGFTPLMLASADGQVAFVALLLARGAHADIQRKDGTTALDLARDKQNTAVIALLLQHNRGP